MKRATLAFVLAAAALAPAAAAQEISALWGSGPSDVWAFRPGGALHFDGLAWSYRPFPLDVQINKVAGSAANNVWLTGTLGGSKVVYRFNGTGWDTVPAPVTQRYIGYLAVTPTHVFVLEHSDTESDTMAVHVWNGSAWTRERLPFSFVAAGMKVVGSEVWIAGYAYFDPRPDTRNQYGVLVRRVAGRWVSNWTGRRSTDPVIGGGSWSHFDVVGDRVLLLGSDTSGMSRILVRRGAAAWRRVETPTGLPDGGYIDGAFLLGDGSPVVHHRGRRSEGLQRHNGTAWEPFAATLTPAAFPPNARIGRGTVNWSPAGADHAYSVVGSRMVGTISALETRVLVAAWCLIPGTTSGSFPVAQNAAICSAIASAPPPGATAPAAAAPQNPAPGTKSATPPTGLPRPARP